MKKQFPTLGDIIKANKGIFIFMITFSLITLILAILVLVYWQEYLFKPVVDSKNIGGAIFWLFIVIIFTKEYVSLMMDFGSELLHIFTKGKKNRK